MSTEEFELMRIRVNFLEKENKGQQELINALSRIVDSLSVKVDLISKRVDLAKDDINELFEQGKDDCK